MNNQMIVYKTMLHNVIAQLANNYYAQSHS